MTSEPASLRERVRKLFALERDVLVLSVAMFAFSLGFQMTSRYLGEYLVALGGSAFVVGLYGTFANVIGAVYPYPGGAISDRIGSRYALTVFGFLSAVGFAVWLAAPAFGGLAVPLSFRRPRVRPSVEVLRAGGDVRHRQTERSARAARGGVRQHRDVPPDRVPRGTAARSRGVRRPRGDRQRVDGRSTGRGGVRLRPRDRGRLRRPGYARPARPLRFRWRRLRQGVRRGFTGRR